MKTILVTGDFLIDHHVYQGTRHHFDDRSCPGVCVAEELGGAALIHRLLQAMPTSLEAPWTSVLGIDESTALKLAIPCQDPDGRCTDRPSLGHHAERFTTGDPMRAGDRLTNTEESRSL